MASNNSPFARLEHFNLSVPDPDKLASLLVKLFDWKIRWQGPTSLGGYTVHVGIDSQYLALYKGPADAKEDSDAPLAGVNHLGIEVVDLEAAESRVLAAGYKSYNHGNYEPGRRFYFRPEPYLEIELLSYEPEPAPRESKLS